MEEEVKEEEPAKIINTTPKMSTIEEDWKKLKLQSDASAEQVRPMDASSAL